MEKEQLKKLLAGLGITALLAGASLTATGCVPFGTAFAMVSLRLHVATDRAIGG